MPEYFFFCFAYLFIEVLGKLHRRLITKGQTNGQKVHKKRKCHQKIMKKAKTSSELKNCFLKMCPDLASLKLCRVLSRSNNSKSSFCFSTVNAAATNVSVLASVPESLISLKAFLSDHNWKPCGISLNSEQSSSALHRYWIDGIKRPMDMDFCKKTQKSLSNQTVTLCTVHRLDHTSALCLQQSQLLLAVRETAL